MGEKCLFLSSLDLEHDFSPRSGPLRPLRPLLSRTMLQQCLKEP